MINKILLGLLTFCFIETLSSENKFLLLLGPSGTGKSTIIRYLKELDDRFVYVTPYTTRALREGEVDKVHIEMSELEELKNSGKLLTVNYLYGIYYATPKDLIDSALLQGKYPVLDWPIDKLDIMEKAYGARLCKVYVEPDNVTELQRRLALDNRDKDGKRLDAGKVELENLLSGKYDQCVDLRIINKQNKAQQTALEIYQHLHK
jgi:guanylate kinase